MTEPDAGAGQAQGGAQTGHGPDTTMSLHPVGAEPAEVAESGLSPADRTAIDALPPGSALLVVQRGPNSGARFLLDAEKTTAGRRPDSDIFLDDVTVSRKHAEFVRKPGGGFVVRDAGSLNRTSVQRAGVLVDRDGASLNGTYVQRDRIGEVVLRDGDEVQIGKYRMVFHPSPRSGGGGGGGGRGGGNAAARRHDDPRASMSIGEVLTALRPDFPDVTISKIRFLEEQGLIDPERTPSGYRKFAHADVERLRVVLSVQRDHYLPLRVIRDHLDAVDAGLDPPPLPGAPRVPRLVPDAPLEPPTSYSR